jgi:DNA-binding IclR family transcriptional regulator
MSKPVTSNPLSSVQSLNRALDLLEAFPRLGPEIGLTRIASELGLSKATAYRLLSTLEERGYVERSSDSRGYRLGLRAFELGSYYQSQLQVRQMALPYLREMVAQTGEAAFLCVREGDQAVCVERVEGGMQVNVFALRVGGHQPLHCGAAPRALLAGLDDDELRAYAERSGLPGITPRTITRLDELLEDVACTRRQGFVFSQDDVTVGIAAVGAPVFDHNGSVLASISLSGLTNRFAPERVSALGEITAAAAARLSRQFGYHAPV